MSFALQSLARCLLPMLVITTGMGFSLAGNAQGLPGRQSQPKPTLDKRFGDWGLSCAVAQDMNGRALERCMVSQLITNAPKSGKVILGVTIDYEDSPTVPTIRFRFAPVALQKAGVGIKIDAKPELRLAIQDCNPQRCAAVGRLTPDIQKHWRTGVLAQFAFLDQNHKQLLFPISLSGLDAALTALQQHKMLAKPQPVARP